MWPESVLNIALSLGSKEGEKGEKEALKISRSHNYFFTKIVVNGPPRQRAIKQYVP